MLTICLPVYRFDPTALVRELVRQAAALPHPVEVLVYDDASPAQDRAAYQPGLQALCGQGVSYRLLPENLGRAAIRNLLAREAAHEALLFLDADSGIVRTDFLAAYLQAVAETAAPLLMGGRVYAQEPPADPVKLLHWHYGHRRESRSAEERRRRPWHGFMSNNFLVRRDLLLRHPFDETIAGYGHEDTLWALQLHRAGVTGIVHLDNPVVHLDLEEATVFLDKQRRATENLRRLLRDHPYLETRLSAAVKRLRKWSIWGLTQVPLRWAAPTLQRQLTAHPKGAFWRLDLLKLHWLAQADKVKE
ncbi:MAG: glycosyltransferase [Saprospiraceae bacterium]